jgi:small conductance mechanosensitive channel
MFGENFLKTLGEWAANAGVKLILAIVTFVIGVLLIKLITKLLKKSKMLQKADKTVAKYAVTGIKALLYIILVISVVAILGVPMASMVAVLASCGVAIGLALQGALSNLAGGIMLLIFRPFRVDDLIEASGELGVAKEIGLFYTQLLTLDNRRVLIPNGTMMNANVVNYSAEPLRRVDIDFTTAKSEDPEKIQKILMTVMDHTPNILQDPAPFARLSGGTDQAQKYTVRAWVNSENYWDVYFNITEGVTLAFAENGVDAPAFRVIRKKEEEKEEE